MKYKKHNHYLIKPDGAGGREDTKLAVEFTDEQIDELLNQGYFLIDDDGFQKLIGNQEKAYSIAADGSIYETPPHVPTIEEVKASKLEEIKQAYLTDVYAPVWVEHTDGRLLGYDADKDSQVDFMASHERAKIAGSTRYNVYINQNDLTQKEFTIHTPEMFEVALAAAGDYQEAVYAKYYVLKAQVEVAVSKEEVAGISW